MTMGDLDVKTICKRMGIALWLSILLHIVSQQPLYAETLHGDIQNEETYHQLRAGKPIQQDREYVRPEHPTVYLTFDDGPSKLTPQVLDILKEENIPATFFVVGEQVEANPEVTKRIVKEGHALGNHSYNHVYRELYADFRTYWEQLQRPIN